MDRAQPAPPAPPVAEAHQADETAFALDLLAHHVPLSLLLDLAQLTLPRSEEIARTERGDVSWVPAPRVCA